MPDDPRNPPDGMVHHRLSWADFDGIAHGTSGARTVRRLRRAERSRRLLLLRALMDEVAKEPESCGLLPSPESAWELLARVQEKAPRVLDILLAHPYTGSWAGYTTRLFHNQINGTCPLWVHIGHMHALAAAGAVRAGLRFETSVPVWHGGVILPTLGMARMPTEAPFSVADVRGGGGEVEVRGETSRVLVPSDHRLDAPGWWGVRQVSVRARGQTLSVRLDDVDPYRGLSEPAPPERLNEAEVDAWRSLLGGAWDLIVRHLPEMSHAIRTGLESLVPQPAVPFRTPSASTGEAFGSAIISRPEDEVELAATLVHEFQHVRLGGLLHLTRLRDDDPRERFYAPWRDDPRPLGGMLQGIYAFFGVTMFWRALAQASELTDRRATFEFAYWRDATWCAVRAVRGDPVLTPAGCRFVDGVAGQLEPWLDERVPSDLAGMATSLVADHYAGWRIRHVRPSPATVTGVTEAWLAGRQRLAGVHLISDRSPTPVPDGSWSPARTDLARLALVEPTRHTLPDEWSTVPEATAADIAYMSGRLTEAMRGYRAELTSEPDRPGAWVGLGLALSGLGARPAARALLACPELVRAVHRRVRTSSSHATAPDELADWIGRHLP